MIELAEPRPPATAADLAAADEALATLGLAIPASYRALLEAHDGGTPVRDTFAFEQDNRPNHSIVTAFFGVARDDDPLADNLPGVARQMQHRVPAGILPIADDPFGNMICIDAREGDGPVLFWDHEYEAEDEPDEANLHFVAADFPTFLASLREPEPLPPAKPRGLKRLFGRR